MLPPTWFSTSTFMGSDAKHLYIFGYQNPDLHDVATPTRSTDTYGIYEFDAVTLTPGAHVTFTASALLGFPEGLLLTERAPS